EKSRTFPSISAWSWDTRAELRTDLARPPARTGTTSTHMGSPKRLRRLVHEMFAPVPEATLAARLDLAAGGRTVLVDRAPDSPADATAKRDAAAGVVETQVRSAGRVVNQETPHELRSSEQGVARK